MFVSICIYLYLFVSVCIYLHLFVSVCICLYLFVSAPAAGSASNKGVSGQFGNDAAAHSMAEGRPPPLKNPPIPRSSSTAANAEPGSSTKKSAGKASATARPKPEVDVNGQPLPKKIRTKRPPKVIEEVTIYFRVKSQAEKVAEEQLEAGFPPSENGSDNEEDNEKGGDEDNPEEEKKD